MFHQEATIETVEMKKGIKQIEKSGKILLIDHKNKLNIRNGKTTTKRFKILLQKSNTCAQFQSVLILNSTSTTINGDQLIRNPTVLSSL